MVGFSCRGKVLLAAVLLYGVPDSAAALNPLVTHLVVQSSSFNFSRFSSAAQVIEQMRFKLKQPAGKDCRYTRLAIERLETRQMFAVSPLSANLPGDYNLDAIVDGADYVSWRKAQSTNVALSNDLSPETVGEDDRDLWRAQFGEVLDNPPVTALLGDYNQNAVVDGADYVSWRKAQSTNAPLSNDLSPETVGEEDRDVWRMQFGEVLDSNWIPMVWAGQDATTVSNTFDLSGEIVVNNPLNPSISWSQVSGTGTASFVDASSEHTAVVFSGAGVYELQLTVANNGVVASDFVTVTVQQGAVGQPELPRELLNTTLDPSYNRPADVVVRAGENLQAALNSAQSGQIIELEAGATFTGNYVLPNKSGNEWIYIRTSGYANLPAAGTRVTPAQASLMSRIVSANNMPAITTDFGAHNFRLIGIEVTTTSPANTCLIQLGYDSGGQAATSLSQLPHHITFDRMYIHGTATGNIRRGIGMNSSHTAVVDSYLSDFHEVGFDSQAIACWGGNGPFKIVNNYLEAAGENVMFGGADPAIANLVPSDIEIRNNHFYKPLSWKIGDPSYAGIPWSVKNLFELKNAQRILVDGNVFENCWPHGQTGFAIVVTPRNQSGTAPWSTVENLTFRNNIVQSTSNGISFLSSDNGGASRPISRILIENNLVVCDTEKFGGEGRLIQLVAGPTQGTDVRIVHNTLIHASSGAAFAVVGDTGKFADDFIWQDNIFTFGTYGFHSPVGAGKTGMDAFFGAYTFDHNAIIVNGADFSIATYPAGNFFPNSNVSVGFVDFAERNFRLSSGSPFKNAAHDGKDLGADIDAIMNALAATPGTTAASIFSGHSSDGLDEVANAQLTNDIGILRGTTANSADSIFKMKRTSMPVSNVKSAALIVNWRVRAKDNPFTISAEKVDESLSSEIAEAGQVEEPEDSIALVSGLIASFWDSVTEQHQDWSLNRL